MVEKGYFELVAFGGGNNLQESAGPGRVVGVSEVLKRYFPVKYFSRCFPP